MNTFRLWCATSICVLTSITNTSHAVAVSGQGNWEATLLARDFDGNANTIEGYYDTAQNITWLADANYPLTSGHDTDGWMGWDAANIWVTGLVINGVGSWRLPRFTDTGNPGCDNAFSGTDCGMNVDTLTSELSYMFYNTLGNLSYYDTDGNAPQPGWGLSNTGPFSNVQFFSYWSDAELVTNTLQAWHFDFILGHQGGVIKTSDQYVWAVHDGDIGVAVIPVPAAIRLFVSGMLGLT